jgi:dihydrofolate synthase/folylpolyglutamate synthase
MDRLGDPQKSVPTVHVAGTKGKGSTAAMISSILTAQGYTAGLYTSPALHRVVERIRVGLEPVDERVFAALVDRVWPESQWVAAHGGFGAVTFFEFITAMAFLHFKQVDADVQVIEVGLGGRLDATNVVSPVVCVITPIMLDHVSVLGDTLELIAGEKAGIIKRGVPVVVAPQRREVMGVFDDVSARLNAPQLLVGRDITWRGRPATAAGQSFDVAGRRGRYRAWIPLIGDYQQENAAAAIAAVEVLADQGIPVSRESIIDGLARVEWPGRLQVLSRDGRQLLVDGAHNPDSMGILAGEVRRHFKFKRLFLIFGATSGHSVEGMLAEAGALSPVVIPVESRHPKSGPAAAIASVARGLGLQVSVGPEDVGGATRRALDMAGEEDLVLGTGSLAVAAEVIEEIEGIVPEVYPSIKPPSSGGG